MNLLEIEDLHIAINGRTVVEGVTFTVKKGERIALVGESGSGKSLTCLAILGLLPAGAVATGSIRFEGVNLLKESESSRQLVRGSRIGCIFQEPLTALDPLMRVGAQMTSALQVRNRISRRDRFQRAVALAREVGLPDPERIVRRYPHELSGGQRQRVMIASVIASKPSLVIADEATTALDVTVQARILSLLTAEVDKTHSGLLFVTHDLAVALQICDRLVVMRQGRVVEVATSGDAISRPRHEYTEQLIDAAYATTWQPSQDIGFSSQTKEGLL